MTDLKFVHYSRRPGKNHRRIVELCNKVIDLQRKMNTMQPVFDAAIAHVRACDRCVDLCRDDSISDDLKEAAGDESHVAMLEMFKLCRKLKP